MVNRNIIGAVKRTKVFRWLVLGRYPKVHCMLVIRYELLGQIGS